MAPHDTDTPKEARRHAVPLIGMAVAVVVVLIGFFWWVGYAAETDKPATPPAAEEPAPAY